MRTQITILIVASAALTGCGGGVEDRPALASVSGSVLYNNKPVAGADVAFWAEGSPRAAKGTTDADGKFTLSMFEPGDGAMLGVNKITVAKMPPAAATASSGDPMNDPMAMASQMQESSTADKVKGEIPAKYSNRNQTSLQETVAEGENSYVLNLVD